MEPTIGYRFDFRTCELDFCTNFGIWLKDPWKSGLFIAELGVETTVFTREVCARALNNRPGVILRFSEPNAGPPRLIELAYLLAPRPREPLQFKTYPLPEEKWRRYPPTKAVAIFFLLAATKRPPVSPGDQVLVFRSPLRPCWVTSLADLKWNASDGTSWPVEMFGLRDEKSPDETKNGLRIVSNCCGRTRKNKSKVNRPPHSDHAPATEVFLRTESLRPENILVVRNPDSSRLVQNRLQRDEPIKLAVEIQTEVPKWPQLDLEERPNLRMTVQRPIIVNQIAQVVGTSASASRNQKAAFIMHQPVTCDRLIGRNKELKELDKAWRSGCTNVVTILGPWGQGKSALINSWLSINDYFRGTAKVLYWSFAWQGEDGSACSADSFIEWALARFGDPNPLIGSPGERGERLVEQIQRQRTLLILDGLEALQNCFGSREGELNSASMKTILPNLAAANPGLCVVTTRLRVPELDSFGPRMAVAIELQGLLPESGARLLKTCGARDPYATLKTIAKESDGHAHTLNLLGTYAHEFLGDSVELANAKLSTDEAVADMLLQEIPKAGRAALVIAGYEKSFSAKAEGGILQVLGLLDSHAEWALVDVLRRAPVVKGLNDLLQGRKEDEIRCALIRLNKAKLLSLKTREDKVNRPLARWRFYTHPVTRAYFRQKLRSNEHAWRHGNHYLFDYYRKLFQPTSKLREGSELFYSAVKYGCEANLYDTVLNKVLKPILACDGLMCLAEDIYRTPESDLVALKSFFEQPWGLLIKHPNFSKTSKGFVLGEVGYTLRALGGSVDDVAKIITAGLNIALEDPAEWSSASLRAGELSLLYLLTDRPAEALKYAQDGMWYTKHIHNRGEREIKFGFHSRILWMAYLFRGAPGDLETARRYSDDSLKHLVEAERMKWQRVNESVFWFVRAYIRWILEPCSTKVSLLSEPDAIRFIKARPSEFFKWLGYASCFFTNPNSKQETEFFDRLEKLLYKINSEWKWRRERECKERTSEQPQDTM